MISILLSLLKQAGAQLLNRLPILPIIEKFTSKRCLGIHVQTRLVVSRQISRLPYFFAWRHSTFILNHPSSPRTLPTMPRNFDRLARRRQQTRLRFDPLASSSSPATISPARVRYEPVKLPTPAKSSQIPSKENALIGKSL